MLSSNQERVYFPIRGSRGRGFSPSGQRRHETRCQPATSVPRGRECASIISIIFLEGESRKSSHADPSPPAEEIHRLDVRTRIAAWTRNLFSPRVSSNDRCPLPAEAEPSLDLSRNFLLLFPRALSSARRFSASCEPRDNAREKSSAARLHAQLRSLVMTLVTLFAPISREASSVYVNTEWIIDRRIRR